ncbi:MAG: DUF4442 domain-containing protein [Bacteroidia bacterium]|nr:DUF4442 domain-containing protein [Bacteroidia bacterium]
MNLTKFRKQATSPIFRLFLLRKLPLAFIAGVRVKKIDDSSCVTSLKFGWINQNPFRSMYFAAMQMAAELTTGLLLYQYVASGNKFSMLLVSLKAEYDKKAIGVIDFVCNQAAEMDQFINEMKLSDEGQTKVFQVYAINQKGEEVAKFEFEWSCKTK